MRLEIDIQKSPASTLPNFFFQRIFFMTLRTNQLTHKNGSITDFPPPRPFPQRREGGSEGEKFIPVGW
jgi:hypothetical protein